MELKDQLEKMGKAFEDFKSAHAKELKEIKEKGYASQETLTLVEKHNNEITGLEAKIEQLSAALNRKDGGNGGESSDEKAAQAYKEAMSGYMRKGRNIEDYSGKVKSLKEYKDMTVEIDQDGGFLVSPEVSAEIVKKVFESNPIRQLASVQTIGTDSLEILQDLDEAGSGWVGETQSRPTTDTPQLNKIVIPVHELYAKPKASQKLLDDAAVNVEQWLAEKVREKFSRDEETAFLNGNGVLKPKGILQYASGTGFGQLERVLTASNSALAADDFISAQNALKEAYQGNASWLIKRQLIAVIRKFKDVNTGQYIWQPGLIAGTPNLLLNKPIYMANDLPSAFAATTDLVVYGDIRAGYQIVDRFGIRVLRDPYSAKPYVEFYTTKRVGGGVKNFEAIKILKGNT